MQKHEFVDIGASMSYEITRSIETDYEFDSRGRIDSSTRFEFVLIYAQL